VREALFWRADVTFCVQSTLVFVFDFIFFLFSLPFLCCVQCSINLPTLFIHRMINLNLYKTPRGDGGGGGGGGGDGAAEAGDDDTAEAGGVESQGLPEVGLAAAPRAPASRPRSPAHTPQCAAPERREARQDAAAQVLDAHRGAP